MYRACPQLRTLLIAALAAVGFALSAPGALALTVSPPSFDFRVAPGAAVSDGIRLHNELDVPVAIRAEAANFTSRADDDAEGVPEFYPASEPGDGRGLAPWIRLVNPEMVIQPGGSGTLFLDVTVPQGAEPGSRFGAVLIRTESDAPEGGGVGIIGSTAVLVLLRVDGDVVEKLELESFAARPSVASRLPVTFEARVRNRGTVHERPLGEVVVTDMLGRVAAVVPLNRFDYKSVLPDGARRFPASWSKADLPEGAFELVKQWKNFAFGRYTADLKLEYGAANQALVASTSFWVVPWMVFLSLAAGVLLAWLAAAGLLKAYRKSVIRQYEREKKGKEG